MNIQFYKYHGTGNDFIIIDNREQTIRLSNEQVAQLCHRHFGIGADGLMLLELEEGYDFRMVYYNSDGNTSTMCGNGGRCITAFAKKLGVIKNEANFIAIDGPHKANIDNDIITLEMQDILSVTHYDDHSILDTGSPHYVTYVEDVATIDVFSEGRQIRNRDEFQPKGINVNFVSVAPDGINVRTYERGVENETMSCGTGVTACAVSTAKQAGSFNTLIHTPGGDLQVSFDLQDNGSAVNVKLIGPAVLAFEGSIEI